MTTATITPPLPSLLLFAHGTSDGRGGVNAVRLAAEVRRLGGFAQVTVGFHLQPPSPAEALATLPAGPVVVVPLLASDGGVARVVLPRLLAQAGGTTGPVRVMAPLGLDAAVIELAGQSIDDEIAAAGVPAAAAGVLVLGHGSSKRPESARATRALAAALQARGGYGDTTALFLEEAPLIRDWPAATGRRTVVAFPFFLSGGNHEEADIPAELAAAGRAPPRLAVSLGRHPALPALIHARALETLGCGAGCG